MFPLASIELRESTNRPSPWPDGPCGSYLSKTSATRNRPFCSPINGTLPPRLLTRYAQRMLIENALSDAVRFFHIDALSSAVGLKVDFDMALLVLASGLYRLIAQRMHGYADAQARQIFRDLIDMPADVTVSDKEVEVSFHRRAHLPILLASDLMEKRIAVPWWDGLSLRLTTYDGRQNTPPA